MTQRRTYDELTRSLAQLEEHLRTIQVVGRVGFWIWDLEANVVWGTSEMHRITGTSPDSGSNFETMFAVVHPDDRPVVESALQRAALTGRYAVDFRILVEGNVRHMEGRGECVRDAVGSVVRMFGTIQDVSERVETEERDRKIREAETAHTQALEINDAIVQGLATAVYWMEAGRQRDALTAIRRTLDAARRMTEALLDPGPSGDSLKPGAFVRSQPAIVLNDTEPPPRRAASLPHKDPATILIADDTPDVRMLVRFALESAAGFAVVAEAADGAQAVALAQRHRPDVALLDVAMPVMDGLQAIEEIRQVSPDTKIVVLSGYAEGRISSRSRELGADAYVEKGEALTEIATVIANLLADRGRVPAPEPSMAAAVPGLEAETRLMLHELRVPLAVLQGVTRTMQTRSDRLSSDLVQEFLNTIYRNVTQMSELVTAFAEAAEIGAESVQLTMHPVDVLALLQEAAGELDDMTPNHPVHIEASGSALAVADANRIRLIVANLVSNAVKFSPAGSPIRVRATVRDGWIDVAVKDRGVGIPEEQRPALFGKFSRLNRERAGLGLGLYISRGMARAHGGDLRLARSDGSGCTFVLTLPAARSDLAGSHGAPGDRETTISRG